MRLFEKYIKNLKTDDNFIYSYGTKVAKIDHFSESIKPLSWWSATTSKHINYVGKEYGYKVQGV